MFVNSTSAIDRVRSYALGPGQRFVVVAIEVCSRILARDGDVTIRWVPAHSGAVGNEVADEYAKSAASGGAPAEKIPDVYSDETSLSHMARVATEARSRETAEWIWEHARAERRYRPLPGRGGVRFFAPEVGCMGAERVPPEEEEGEDTEGEEGGPGPP